MTISHTPILIQPLEVRRFMSAEVPFVHYLGGDHSMVQLSVSERGATLLLPNGNTDVPPGPCLPGLIRSVEDPNL